MEKFNDINPNSLRVSTLKKQHSFKDRYRSSTLKGSLSTMNLEGLPDHGMKQPLKKKIPILGRSHSSDEVISQRNHTPFTNAPRSAAEIIIEKCTRKTSSFYHASEGDILFITSLVKTLIGGTSFVSSKLDSFCHMIFGFYLKEKAKPDFSRSKFGTASEKIFLDFS